jgi:hypothetical protein
MWLPERITPFAPNEVVGNVVRMNLAVDLGFPYPARDELRVLCAEVENQDLFVHLIRPDS